MSRKYELEISDFSTNEVLLSFGLSSDNPSGPEIQFNIQQLPGNVGLLDMGNVPQTLTSKSNYQHKIKNIASLDNLLQGVHGLTIIQKQSGFTLYSPLSPAAPTQKTVYLKAGDFICQPSLIDGKTYTEVALTLIMRSDINVNDFVVIPQEIWVGISALDVVADARALIDMFKGKSVFSMFSGKYKVNSIWQLGDAKNGDPNLIRPGKAIGHIQNKPGVRLQRERNVEKRRKRARADC